MEEFLKQMLRDILGNTYVIGADALKESVAGYNETAYAFANQINEVAVKPIAAVIVAIVLVLELARISSRFEGDSKTGVQVAATAIIKAVLIVVAIQNTDLILKAINEVGDKIVKVVGPMIQSSNAATVEPSVPNLSTVEQVGAMIILFLPWIIAVAASLLVKLLVMLRFAEIYILSAAATLPISFLGHEETKNMAIGYLKRYGTAVLHGVMILVVIGVYGHLQIDGVTLDPNDGIVDIMKQIPSLLFGPLLFIFLLFSSGKFSRALVGEG